MMLKKDFFLLLALFSFVLLVNAPLISLDLMYAEQPLIYVANQNLHSFLDFLHIYLDPQMLHVFSIPFFRPSGHFLLYQLLAPLLGWHNTRGFLIINLLFLALSGYLLIKVYELLFPGFKVGGYLAFSLYLMHPALILSRLIVLHFEFAYVFFVLLSLYCFIWFYQKSPRRLSVFAAALFFYIIAVTFKEPALMLGPVLASYFIIYSYNKTTGLRSLINKQNMEIVFIIGFLCLALVIYLSLPWPAWSHPLGNVITAQEKLAAIKEFIKLGLGISREKVSQSALYQPDLIWRKVLFPPLSAYTIWAFWGFLSFTIARLLIAKQGKERCYQKAMLFLSLATLLFMILPINWAMGLPWHLSLSLLCLSLLMGFSGEYFLQFLIKSKSKVFLWGLAMASLIGLSTLLVNQVNVSQLLAQEGFALKLGRNAVLFPPRLSGTLNEDSVLVVEDSLLHNSYALGDSGYTFFADSSLDYDALQRAQSFSFLKYQTVYNGNLFKWAYLRPSLQEDIYPFRVEQMAQLPDLVLYDWLQHYDNIFCLGYDHKGQWHDKTLAFKENLLREKRARLMNVYPYEPQSAASLNGKILYTKNIPFPEHRLCQYECDQNVQCKGFTYENAEYQHHSTIKCQFYDAHFASHPKFCATCIGFVKEV